MGMIELQRDPWVIRIEEDITYTPRSADNLHRYDREHAFGRDGHHLRYAVRVLVHDRPISSCILLTSGGGTAVHEHSAVVVGDSCVVAIGDTLCSLPVPELTCNWSIDAGQGTCFGVHHAIEHRCLILHGELEIMRVEYDGRIAWKARGTDIFTGELTIRGDYVDVTDFNGRLYGIRIEDGTQLDNP